MHRTSVVPESDKYWDGLKRGSLKTRKPKMAT